VAEGVDTGTKFPDVNLTEKVITVATITQHVNHLEAGTS